MISIAHNTILYATTHKSKYSNTLILINSLMRFLYCGVAPMTGLSNSLFPQVIQGTTNINQLLFGYMQINLRCADIKVSKNFLWYIWYPLLFPAGGSQNCAAGCENLPSLYASFYPRVNEYLLRASHTVRLSLPGTLKKTGSVWFFPFSANVTRHNKSQ